MGKKIAILSPAWPYRGGIAAFSERLAAELVAEGREVEVFTFTLQYPSFLFPGKTQYSDSPRPEGYRITRVLSSINPFSWIKAGRAIRNCGADTLIVAQWMPYMAPALASAARHSRCPERIGLVHNLLPHEKKAGSRLFARMFCRAMTSFITLSESVREDLAAFSDKPCKVAPHPIYDNFGPAEPKEDACRALGLDPSQKYLLSFGLIRDYKGLDWLLEAYASSRREARLIVAGEFYSDGEKYHAQARELGIDSEVIWHNEYVPDSDVKHWFCASDLVVQPYRSATQSGVTQIAYNFGCPMLVTRVGGLPEIVPDGRCGYAVDPSPAAISAAIDRFTAECPDFSAGLSEERRKYSWAEFVKKTL